MADAYGPNNTPTVPEDISGQVPEPVATYEVPGVDPVDLPLAEEAPAFFAEEVDIPAAGKAPKSKSYRPVLTGLVAGVLAAVLACAGTLGIVRTNAAKQNATVTNTKITSESNNVTIKATGEDITLPEAVAAKALPSVVSIDVYTQASSYSYGSNRSNSGELQYSGIGSGCIISEDGFILTNYHVVQGSADLVVHLDDGAQVNAEVVGADPTSDLAVIKIDAEGLVPFEIGSSKDLNVGQWCMTLGSPFGYERSVSAGIVSALCRSTALSSDAGVTIYANLIQTDAAINPGNSGGALVNSKGELIGVPTLFSSYSQSSSAVGFAIPIDYAYNVATQIMEGKEVTHAFLGVTLQSVTAANASELGVSGTIAGAYVEQVESGSPADDAGIQVGDVIVGFDGETTSTADELIIQTRARFVGDEVDLVVIRNGQEMTIPVTLGAYVSSGRSGSEQGDQGDTSDPSDVYEYLYKRYFGN